MAYDEAMHPSLHYCGFCFSSQIGLLLHFFGTFSRCNFCPRCVQIVKSKPKLRQFCCSGQRVKYSTKLPVYSYEKRILEKPFFTFTFILLPLYLKHVGHGNESNFDHTRYSCTNTGEEDKKCTLAFMINSLR